MSPSDPLGGPCAAGQVVEPGERDSSPSDTPPRDAAEDESSAPSERTFRFPEIQLAGVTEEPREGTCELEGPAAEPPVAPVLEEPAAEPPAAPALEGPAAEPPAQRPSTTGAVPPPEISVESPEISQEVLPPGDQAGSADGVGQPTTRIPRGSDMRARLLERAAAARRRSDTHGLSSESEGALDAVGRPEQPTRDSELDVLGPTAPRPPSAPVAARPRGQLSPNLIAAFGTLLGLATIATIVALAMRIDATSSLALFGSAAPAPTAEASAKPAQPQAPAPRKRQRQKLPGPWRIRDVKGRPGARIVTGKVGREPFLRAVQAAGVPAKQAYRLLIAYKGVKDLDNCKRTDSFAALIDSASSRLKAFEYIVSPEEVYQVREGQDGLLRGKRLDLQVHRDRVQGAFVCDGSSVESAAERGGFEPALSDALSDALEGHMSLAELDRGDRVRVIAQEVTVLGEFSRYAGIEAVEVKHSDPKQPPFRVYYFRGSKSRGHYDDRGHAPYEGGWRKPIKDAPVTSPFDMKRRHPILKKIMPHTGVDFGAKAGTPIGATSFGTVSFMGWAGATGNLVKIVHPGNYESGYAHLSRFAEDLSVGDKVRRMQVVGYVGSTGRSTGPHLHFSIKKDGKFIDPQTLNLDGMRVLPQDERAEFDKVRESYVALLEAIPWPAPLPDAVPPSTLLASDTAPASSGTAEGVEETIGSGMEEEPESADSAKPAAAPAAARAPAQAPETAPAGTAAVYLTDKELMEQQPLTDDGEVAE
ncbi:MAG: peptidoglycan DD-metalloendopeptidase family protein [Polyangiaceae bacterium]|nr:peptidoglycan DD-metalloendopeptidase family protein [Polyangiaceae bacterium]